MARRGTVGALLTSGLVAMIAIGGAGGYGVGLLTTTDQSAAATGTAAAPLGGPGSSSPTPTATPSPTPPRKVTYDDSPALKADDLKYKTRSFTVKNVVKSAVSVRVPWNWDFTQPDPPTTGRFTDPTHKRWLRLEAGFTIRRPPAESMQVRIGELNRLPADQSLNILSQDVEGNAATLAYTYVPPKEQSPEGVLRYVVVRWVADDSGNCAVEMSSTGLPQDKEALLAVLDRAADSVRREDSPLTAGGTSRFGQRP
ncbi:hypothetical protein AB0L70_00275 [Kribbella sp. NPDC051952]|uniref:hypothetical protein n=1 Tax=Kribbella sp. NPDC051952 TaxID=3154851 RepID=UPI003446E848